jgi:hypothetical protein
LEVILKIGQAAFYKVEMRDDVFIDQVNVLEVRQELQDHANSVLPPTKGSKNRIGFLCQLSDNFRASRPSLGCHNESSNITGMLFAV